MALPAYLLVCGMSTASSETETTIRPLAIALLANTPRTAKFNKVLTHCGDSENPVTPFVLSRPTCVHTVSNTAAYHANATLLHPSLKQKLVSCIHLFDHPSISYYLSI